MKRVFSSPDLIQSSQLKDLLEQEGIPCVIRNEILGGLSPEVPFTETFPEVWVRFDEDLPRAVKIKSDWQRGKPIEASEWSCWRCGERLEGQFTSCWQCGEERPSVLGAT